MWTTHSSSGIFFPHKPPPPNSHPQGKNNNPSCQYMLSEGKHATILQSRMPEDLSISTETYSLYLAGSAYTIPMHQHSSHARTPPIPNAPAWFPARVVPIHTQLPLPRNSLVTMR